MKTTEELLDHHLDAFIDEAEEMTFVLGGAIKFAEVHGLTEKAEKLNKLDVKFREIIEGVYEVQG